jgi:glycerol-3-phosphate acyltransferase PlsY
MGNFCCAEFNSFANHTVSLNIAAVEPVFNVVAVVLIAYLLGSINFSYLVYKKKTGKDIRTVGSKNPGASNIRRFLGWKYYLLVLALDILKGLVAVLIADWFTKGDITIISIAGAAAIIGHSYPFWLGFKVGKSVAVTIGVFIPIGFWAVLIFAVCYFSLVGIFKIVSIASLSGAFLLAAATFLFGYPLPVKLLAIFSLFLIVYRHRSNIIRLIRKEELSYSKTRTEDE